MVVTFAFLVLTTLAPANLYVFSDLSLKYSPVLVTSFSNPLKVVWTGNPLLDLSKVVWTGKPLLNFKSERKANAKAEKEGPAA